MDEHNVRQFWGSSPAIDLTSRHSIDTTSHPLCILQICPSDCRHTAVTLATIAERRLVGNTLVVFEDFPDAIARHVLLLWILLDDSLPHQRAVEMFLEIHGNIHIRADTATYLREASTELQKVVLGSPSTLASTVVKLFDFSQLTYKQRDNVAEVFRSYQSEEEVDMGFLWDRRCRKYYGQHYDFRGNKIDWDYWMRLCPKKQDEALSEKSVIHHREFAAWRATGTAHNFRDKRHSHPNTTLITAIPARTKEFKNRNGCDVGRTVFAKGYWGDVINSPYHSFGTWSTDSSAFEKRNGEFKKSASDVSIDNVKKLRVALGASVQSSVVFLSGDIQKRLCAKARFWGKFDVVFVSCHCARVLQKQFGMQRVLNKGAIIFCEEAINCLSLSTQQAQEFRDACIRMAVDQSWTIQEFDLGNCTTERSCNLSFVNDLR